MTEDLTLEDLATMTGMTLRTLRYYIQEGILQGPDTRGKNARYSQEHLDRLELIQRLKNLRLPLQEIKQLLNNMTPEEISQIRKYQDILHLDRKMKYGNIHESFSKPGSSALDYIQNLQRGRENIQSLSISNSSPNDALRRPEENIQPQLIQKYPSDTKSNQENWRRIVIIEGVELNIREPSGTNLERKINKLIEFARKLFGNQSY